MPLVQEAIATWEVFRAGVIAEIENTPEEHLDYRPGEGARTVREVALHVAEAGVVFTNELLRPDGNLWKVVDPQVQAEVRATLPRAHSKAEVITLLRLTWEQVAGRLHEAGEALAEQTMPTRRGTQSRLSALWFAMSHEMYHRGQLAAYARGFGVVPALTQQIAAARAR